MTSGLKVYVDWMVDGKVIQTREIIGDALYNTTTGTATIGASQLGGNGEEVSELRPYSVRFEMFNSWRSFQYRIRKPDYGVFELHAISFRYKGILAYPIHY
jgi:hypothetical protein